MLIVTQTVRILLINDKGRIIPIENNKKRIISNKWYLTLILLIVLLFLPQYSIHEESVQSLPFLAKKKAPMTATTTTKTMMRK